MFQQNESLLKERRNLGVGEAALLPLQVKTVAICKEQIRALRDQFPRSVWDKANRELGRERLEVDKSKRPDRKELKAADYKRLYNRQRGICPWCENEMAMPKFWPGKLEADHIDPNVEGDGYLAWTNLQLLHERCNQEKNAMSIADQAKHLGRTFTEILQPGFEKETGHEQE